MKEECPHRKKCRNWACGKDKKRGTFIDDDPQRSRAVRAKAGSNKLIYILKCDSNACYKVFPVLVGYRLN